MTPSIDRRGFAYAAAAHVVWGLFPIFMAALRPADAYEILAHRMVWSLVACLAVIAMWRRWDRLKAIVSDRPTLLWLGLAATLIGVSWFVMVYAVLTDRVASAALGNYFNPLLTVALGVFVLGELLRRLQVFAIVLGTAAVVVVGLDIGGIPWIPLILAGTFAGYSFIKKKVGPRVDALTGMAVETAWMIPIGVAILIATHAMDTRTFLERGEPGLGVTHDLLLMSTGVWTATPLILFAAGAARLTLSITGLMQYISPTIVFMLAIWHFHEPMPASRWAGFALVWVALVLISVDGWRNRSRAQAEPALI